MKFITNIVFLILVLPVVFAGNPPDWECDTYCDPSEPVAKWEWEDGTFYEDAINGDYITSISGDDEEANWTSNPMVSCVLVKSGQEYQVYTGGTIGTVYRTDAHEISHVTMCARDTEVPEFGVLGAMAVLVGAGIIVSRKK